MCCQGHQRGDTTAAWGNCKADPEAKLAASKGTESAALTTALLVHWQNGTLITHNMRVHGLRLKMEATSQVDGGNLKKDE